MVSEWRKVSDGVSEWTHRQVVGAASRCLLSMLAVLSVLNSLSYHKHADEPVAHRRLDVAAWLLAGAGHMLLHAVVTGARQQLPAWLLLASGTTTRHLGRRGGTENDRTGKTGK